MATTTPRIGLTKPDGTDLVDIAVLNTNFDKIDSNIASTKIQSTKPTTANAGDLWWDSDTGTLYLYYTDANSSQWVAATSDPINIGVVANQTERDAQYPTPAQGMSVYRTDLGVTQRYYGLFNVSTNPGGRDTAGWYNTEKSVGLVPIQVPTIITSGGSSSVSSSGQITFSGVSGISFVGALATYRNYKIFYEITSASATDSTLGFRTVASSTINTADYFFGGTQVGHQSANNLIFGASQSSFTVGPLASAGAGSYGIGGHIDVEGANYATQTKIQVQATQSSSAVVYGVTIGGAVLNTTQYDGFQLLPFSGTMGGVVSIYGINDK